MGDGLQIGHSGNGSLTADYEARIYAGVLGKIIGVYLGRPLEGWSNRDIEARLGEIRYYVHETLGAPLIVSDDDISGTFTFLRALPDHGNTDAITAAQIGQTWLNYLIENRTVLWWGGLGLSTEHTAYLRLKDGIAAPRSGSAATNGKIVSEQIGSQIFIDGWAMVCPGDPERAAALAGKAASVSHDGEAIYGAQVMAAMEALAFVEPRIPRLMSGAAKLISADSVLYRLMADITEWHAAEPNDWRATFRKIERHYGYDTYGGNCHIIPNHAVILLALLYGQDDFQKSLMIANTAGWDTDCNSGNVGCLLGIKNGLAGLDAGPDWRGPVADRLYLPTSDGARCVTDALTEAYRIVDIARRMRDLPPIAPKNGARYHFSLPGSVQGFVPYAPDGDTAMKAAVENVRVVDRDLETRMLAIRYRNIVAGAPCRVATATFPDAAVFRQAGYQMVASPSLYPGQPLQARLRASDDNAHPCTVRLSVSVVGKDDVLESLDSPERSLAPGEAAELEWTAPESGGRPIAQVGIAIDGDAGDGTLFLDWLTWSGAPRVAFSRPRDGGDAWRRAWVNAVDHFDNWGLWDGNTYKLIQDGGVGLVFQGDYAWADYTVLTEMYAHLAEEIGVLADVRGLRRYVALTLRPDGLARLLLRHDDEETVLAEAPIPWKLDHRYPVTLTTRPSGTVVASITDGGPPIRLTGTIPADRARGAIGLLVRAGHAQFGDVHVYPANRPR